MQRQHAPVKAPSVTATLLEVPLDTALLPMLPGGCAEVDGTAGMELEQNRKVHAAQPVTAVLCCLLFRACLFRSNTN